jgi:glycerol-3-phosphate acyltransferase PlsY
MAAMLPVILLAPVAYLAGTFPSAALVTGAKGKDVTKEGSGNPGASNTFRLLGWKAGLLVLFLDIGKGALAAGTGAALDGHRGAYLLGVAAVIGHVLPITRGLHGGRGVATGAGVLIVIFPLVLLILGVVWFAIARGLKKASIASIVCAFAFPVIVAARGGGALDISVTTGLAFLVLATHFHNLLRLVRGEEHGVETAPAVGARDEG